MIGAIAGDVIGSVHEQSGTKTADFPLFVRDSRFTDDSVLTAAVAECLLKNRPYGPTFREYFHTYPNAGYGAGFWRWAQSAGEEPYYSFGNGSAMRVSPVGWAFETLDEVLAEARRSAEVTHNHPSGIRGAQAVAAAVFLARTGAGKQAIRHVVQQRTGYDLERRLDDIRPGYRFNVTCDGSVPESVIAFLESEGYEDAVRRAISLGGDADTMASIAGGIAEAYYGEVPPPIVEAVIERLDPRLAAVVTDFADRYMK